MEERCGALACLCPRRQALQALGLTLYIQVAQVAPHASTPPPHHLAPCPPSHSKTSHGKPTSWPRTRNRLHGVTLRPTNLLGPLVPPPRPPAPHRVTLRLGFAPLQSGGLSTPPSCGDQPDVPKYRISAKKGPQAVSSSCRHSPAAVGPMPGGTRQAGKPGEGGFHQRCGKVREPETVSLRSAKSPGQGETKYWYGERGRRKGRP